MFASLYVDLSTTNNVVSFACLTPTGKPVVAYVPTRIDNNPPVWSAADEGFFSDEPLQLLFPDEERERFNLEWSVVVEALLS